MVLTATGYVPIEAGVSSSSSSSPAGRAPRGAGAAGTPLTRGSMRTRRFVDVRDPGDDASLGKYSPDQPRVPAGTPDGGQWATEEGTSGTSSIQVAGAGDLRCEGFSAGCQSGGSYGTSAMYRIRGLNLCRNCAVKILGIENAPSNEQVDTLDPFSIQRK
jgi:hypothetical protein